MTEKKTILIDFSKGDLAMKNMIVRTGTGLEAIKNKIEKLIRTEKGLAQIYTGIDYGINKERVIGKEYNSNIKEVQSLFLEIKNKVLNIDGVTNILKWSKTIEGDKLILDFEVETIYGTIGDEISL